jgi:hypothetical protein
VIDTNFEIHIKNGKKMEHNYDAQALKRCFVWGEAEMKSKTEEIRKARYTTRDVDGNDVYENIDLDKVGTCYAHGHKTKVTIGECRMEDETKRASVEEARQRSALQSLQADARATEEFVVRSESN